MLWMPTVSRGILAISMLRGSLSRYDQGTGIKRLHNGPTPEGLSLVSPTVKDQLFVRLFLGNQERRETKQNKAQRITTPLCGFPTNRRHDLDKSTPRPADRRICARRKSPSMYASHVGERAALGRNFPQSTVAFGATLPHVQLPSYSCPGPSLNCTHF
jgi:hypothetical protein